MSPAVPIRIALSPRMKGQDTKRKDTREHTHDTQPVPPVCRCNNRGHGTEPELTVQLAAGKVQQAPEPVAGLPDRLPAPVPAVLQAAGPVAVSQGVFRSFCRTGWYQGSVSRIHHRTLCTSRQSLPLTVLSVPKNTTLLPAGIPRPGDPVLLFIGYSPPHPGRSPGAGGRSAG